MGRPGLNSRDRTSGKKIGFVGDGGLNDALVKFVIEKLTAAGIKGLREEPMPPGGDAELEALSAAKSTPSSARRRNPSTRTDKAANI